MLFSVAILPLPSRATPIVAGGYTFTNFDFPNGGNILGTGTNSNGIANNGAAVGFSIANNGNLSNFVRNADGTFTALNISGSTAAMAFGISSAGDVVGTDGSGHAFFLPFGGSPQTLTTPAGATAAFGINDKGNIVGQYASVPFTPGFFLANNTGSSFVKIDAPSGPDTVNAQGVNDSGLIVGFYLGTDGQVHGFDANVQNAIGGEITGSAIADPTIPSVAGEPGATFIFSQILGINDSGIAVGYYGDSTTSQHGFFYNTNTGAYSFLDDPSAQFDNGVEVTQITGINNSNEITGFYSDASGVFHGFVACPTGLTCPASPTPEPPSLALLGIGLLLLAAPIRKRALRS